MQLTRKIILVILLLCILFSVLFFLLLRLTLFGGIQEQKYTFANRIIVGALSVFERETDRIFTFIEDWSAWDTMYSYVSAPGPRLEQDLAVLLTIKDGNFSLFLAVNKKKEVIRVEGYDHLKKQPISYDLLKQKKGDPWKFLNQTFNREESAAGIVDSQYGPMIVVSSPILHSDNSGPVNGRLLMGRLIDDTFEESIAKVIREKAYLLITSKERIYVKKKEKILQLYEEKNLMRISYPVTDVWGRQLFTLRLDVRKHTFKILEKAILIFMLALIAGMLLLGAALYFIMDRLVVRRIKQISDTTNRVLSLDDLSQQIHLAEFYRDEITQLGENINEMLKRLKTEKISKEEVERMALLNEKLIFLGRITANVTHEINNPLFAIENSIRFIKKHLTQNQGDKQLNEVILVVEREIKRVKAIAQNVHKYAVPKIEETQLSDITTIMDAAIKVIYWSKPIEHISIDYLKKNYSFPLFCNPATLQQVFMNIILNSIEAIEGKGKIVIDVSEIGNIYKIDFIDNGPGFSNIIKKKLFEPFRSTKSGKGVGLGLNISHTIIKNHGGTITLNENYCEGAHLIVNIPKGDLKNDAKNNTIVNR